MRERADVAIPAVLLVGFAVVAALTDSKYDIHIAAAAVSDLAFVGAIVCVVLLVFAWRRSLVP